MFKYVGLVHARTLIISFKLNENPWTDIDFDDYVPRKTQLTLCNNTNNNTNNNNIQTKDDENKLNKKIIQDINYV